MGLPQWMWIWHMSMVTSVMVPFGILLHYWRRPGTAYAFADASDGASTTEAQRAVRRQVLVTRVTSGLAFILVILSQEGVWLPNSVSDHWTSFLVPMAVATVCILVVLVTVPTSLHGVSSQRDIDSGLPTVRSFGRGSWVTGWIVAATALIVAVILAGLASSLDSAGRYAAITDGSGEVTGSGSFPGWYFGVPILIGIAILAVATLVALRLDARRSLSGESRSVDRWLRHHRARVVLLVGAGALVLTLGWALISIGSGLSIRVSGPAGTIGSPFAALSIPLRVAGLVLQGVGVAMFLLPVFTRQVHARDRLPTPARGSLSVARGQGDYSTRRS